MTIWIMKILMKVIIDFYSIYIKYNDKAITNKIVKMHFENVVQFWDSVDEFFKEHNEYEKYQENMPLPKAQSKVRLMIDTHSSKLRKEYANIFIDEEKYCFSTFRKGEKLMLTLVRYRLFGLAQLFHNLLVWKNKTI